MPAPIDAISDSAITERIRALDIFFIVIGRSVRGRNANYFHTVGAAAYAAEVAPGEDDKVPDLDQFMLQHRSEYIVGQYSRIISVNAERNRINTPVECHTPTA